MMLGSDVETIVGLVGNCSKVLDLGCGSGDLLAKLSLEKGIDGVGVDIDTKNLTTALTKGLRVIQQDMEDGLPNFENTQFDVVIIADSLQVLKRPHAMLTRVVQIGH